MRKPPKQYVMESRDTGMLIRREAFPAQVTVGRVKGNLPRLDDVGMTYVGFYVSTLHFNEMPFCPEVYVYPGAEWHSVGPAWQFPHQTRSKGKWAAERFEIWKLTEDRKQLLLADDVGALRMLTLNTSGEPILRKVTPLEIFRYLCARGTIALEREYGPSVQWVIDSLNAMQKEFPELRKLRSEDNIEQVIARFVMGHKRLPKDKKK